MGRNVDRCPRCGAPPCHQKFDPFAVVDWSKRDSSETINPIDGFICPNCRGAFRVGRLETDGDFIYEWQTEYEFTPIYCPNCGCDLRMRDA